jgi:hypothetical protein
VHHHEVNHAASVPSLIAGKIVVAIGVGAIAGDASVADV